MNQKIFLITGQFSFVLAFAGFLFNYFLLGTNAVVAFVVGILFGLSLVMNLAYFLKRRSRRRFDINVK